MLAVEAQQLAAHVNCLAPICSQPELHGRARAADARARPHGQLEAHEPLGRVGERREIAGGEAVPRVLRVSNLAVELLQPPAVRLEILRVLRLDRLELTCLRACTPHPGVSKRDDACTRPWLWRHACVHDRGSGGTHMCMCMHMSMHMSLAPPPLAACVARALTAQAQAPCMHDPPPSPLPARVPWQWASGEGNGRTWQTGPKLQGGGRRRCRNSSTWGSVIRGLSGLTVQVEEARGGLRGGEGSRPAPCTCAGTGQRRTCFRAR